MQINKDALKLKQLPHRALRIKYLAQMVLILREKFQEEAVRNDVGVEVPILLLIERPLSAPDQKVIQKIVEELEIHQM